MSRCQLTPHLLPWSPEPRIKKNESKKRKRKNIQKKTIPLPSNAEMRQGCRYVRRIGPCTSDLMQAILFRSACSSSFRRSPGSKGLHHGTVLWQFNRLIFPLFIFLTMVSSAGPVPAGGLRSSSGLLPATAQSMYLALTYQRHQALCSLSFGCSGQCSSNARLDTYMHRCAALVMHAHL
jgi:hypothetical protein